MKAPNLRRYAPMGLLKIHVAAYTHRPCAQPLVKAAKMHAPNLRTHASI
jgi:hypothetical protein